jgi:hypothetical protein
MRVEGIIPGRGLRLLAEGQKGVREKTEMVQRNRKFPKWANPAFLLAFSHFSLDISPLSCEHQK